ncbi:c-type cytochrome, methanol metabolism-related [Paracoccus spongiarum]|uniref:C-type cytochrome, methanol metabolism-related n=1 Tax=Paracoccus spongiarum TaxID=3064387 RepID=A0ABT9JB60_9RHOB|nr:c-type cytochrome, methanol metabolism-related [Paracoccus sp. 2205BS29-5]MDP5307038.1 c-type cytochrome, methanol metabolism-related [Paracoccus sp. 2205BS29-5]
MKAISSLAALVLGAFVAGAAFAQTDAAGDTPPAEAGAGAAAAVSGTAEAPAADAAAAEPADAGGGDAAAGKVLANGMDITPANMENGRWYNADGIPVYKIDEDGTVDFATFNGYRRYSAECHVCHGPDGEGSTYAPALKNSVLRMDYYDFQQIVASGKQDVNAAQNQVMPAFGTNKNVWCYIDDIYAYLLARGTGDLPRGRPAKKADKPDEFTAQEDSCMSM